MKVKHIVSLLCFTIGTVFLFLGFLPEGNTRYVLGVVGGWLVGLPFGPVGMALGIASYLLVALWTTCG